MKTFLLFIFLLTSTVANAASTTAWFRVCIDMQGTTCYAQAWQQITVPDSVVIDWIAANQIALSDLIDGYPALDLLISNYGAWNTAINNGLLTGHVLTDAEYTQFQTLVAGGATGGTAGEIPFDAELAQLLWFAGFGSLLLLYITAYGIGLAIRMIKDKP